MTTSLHDDIVCDIIYDIVYDIVQGYRMLYRIRYHMRYRIRYLTRDIALRYRMRHRMLYLSRYSVRWLHRLQLSPFLCFEGDRTRLFDPVHLWDNHTPGNSLCCTSRWQQTPRHPCCKNDKRLDTGESSGQQSKDKRVH